MPTSDLIPRDNLGTVFTDRRILLWADALQNAVFESPFNNLGTPTASTTPSDTSIPIIINGVQYYLKLSTTP